MSPPYLLSRPISGLREGKKQPRKRRGSDTDWVEGTWLGSSRQADQRRMCLNISTPREKSFFSPQPS